MTIPFPGTKGIDIHYQLSHTGEGEIGDEVTYVLLHGFADNLVSWHEVFDFFGTQGTVVAYDRPGSGLGDRITAREWTGEDPYHFESSLSHFLTFVDELGLGKMVLVGNSYGGLMALELARRFPDRVVGLILAAPAVYTPRRLNRLSRIAKTGFVRWLIKFNFYLLQFLTWFVLLALYARPSRISRKSKQRWRNDYRVINYLESALAMTYALIDFPDITDGLSSIQQPTLIIHGARDRALPVGDSQKLSLVLGDPELCILPTCGHVPMDERPKAFMQVSADWIKRRIEIQS